MQDHRPPPNESLLLPPLDILYKSHVRNQELPQPGDSRPVMSPSQRALSKQMMKGTVGNKHAKVEQLTDASAIGPSHATNYSGDQYTRP